MAAREWLRWLISEQDGRAAQHVRLLTIGAGRLGLP